LGAIAVAIGLGYPFLVYFGISAFGPEALVMVVLILLGARVLIMRKTLPTEHRLIWPAVVAIVVMAVAAFLHSAVAVKIYPVVISLLLGVAFLWSVLRPPTVIEMIARISEPDLDGKGIQYTRNVTIVWVAFFAVNASIALWTVMYGTLEQWTLYNGLISYCLTGLLFAVEFMVRRFVRAKG